MPGVSFQSRADGVTHPEKSLTDMRGAEARSAGINRPDGVARAFQVSEYKVDPSEAVRARNLLTNDDSRTALADEPVERGPQVPLVSKPAAFADRAERLTRARAGPDGAIVGPAGKTQGERPDADAGKEVALPVSGKLIWRHVFDASLIYITCR